MQKQTEKEKKKYEKPSQKNWLNHSVMIQEIGEKGRAMND